MSRITIAIAGLGSRGKDAYAQALAQMPERAKVVAIADPDAAKVREVARQFEIPAERCFDSAEALLAEPRLADALVLCTQDRQHVPQAIPALRKGYDILMEKPISPDLAQCKEILSVARETGRKVVVCHVLRYAPFYRKIKEVTDDGGVVSAYYQLKGVEADINRFVLFKVSKKGVITLVYIEGDLDSDDLITLLFTKKDL